MNEIYNSLETLDIDHYINTPHMKEYMKEYTKNAEEDDIVMYIDELISTFEISTYRPELKKLINLNINEIEESVPELQSILFSEYKRLIQYEKQYSDQDYIPSKTILEGLLDINLVTDGDPKNSNDIYFDLLIKNIIFARKHYIGSLIQRLERVITYHLFKDIDNIDNMNDINDINDNQKVNND